MEAVSCEIVPVDVAGHQLVGARLDGQEVIAVQYLEGLLGLALADDEISDILARLGMQVTAAGTGAYRRNLVSMVGLARAHGVTPVLVSFAAKGPDPDSAPGLLAGIAEHNDVIRDVCREHSVPYVDLDGALSRDGTFAVSARGDPDPVHLNPKGTLEKARIIAEGLLPHLP